MVRNGRSTTWESIDRSADLVAAGLRRAGVGPGDVVANVLPSGAEWVVVAVAVDRIGAVHAGVSSHLAPPERGALVESVAA